MDLHRKDKNWLHALLVSFHLQLHHSKLYGTFKNYFVSICTRVYIQTLFLMTVNSTLFSFFIFLFYYFNFLLSLSLLFHMDYALFFFYYIRLRSTVVRIIEPPFFHFFSCSVCFINSFVRPLCCRLSF